MKRLAAGIALFWLIGSPAAQPPVTQPPVTQPPITQPQESLIERAIGAERRGEHAVAADLYLELFAANPDRPEWAVAAGRCLGMVGRYNDALDLLDKSRDRFPDALEIRAMLARTFLLKAENMLRGGIRDLNVTLYLRDAVSTCEEVLAAAPDNRDTRLILAQSLLALGEEDEALRHAEEAVERFPDHPGGHILVGRIWLDRYVALRRRIEAERPTGQVQADLIQRAYEQRERARNAFESAIDADPDRAYPHKVLGDLQSWIGNLPGSLAYYHQALVVDPRIAIDHESLRANLDAMRRVAFYGAALQAYRQRPDAEPARAAVLAWHVGMAHLDNESWGQAQASFEQALEGLPDDGNTLYYATISAYRAADFESAERHAAAYAESRPAGFADLIRGLSDPDREGALGMLDQLARQAYGAERLGNSREINRVLAYVIDTADCWNNYAFLCRETGRFEDSLEGYRRAMQREPDSPQLLNDAGVILQYFLTSPENLAQAREYYERAIALADELLGDHDLTAEARQRIRKAREDAVKNLAEMKLPAAA